MDNRLIASVLAAVAIYLIVAAIFGTGIETIAKQVPAGVTDPQFAPVVCSLAVACSYKERIQNIGLVEKGALRSFPDGK